MPSYLLLSLCHLLLLGCSGALAFFLIQDKATLSSYLSIAGSALALLSLLLTFVRRRQCTLARDTSNNFRASPMVTALLRLTAVLLFVFAAASAFLALLVFNIVSVPSFLGSPAAIVGERAAVNSGVMQGMSSPSATGGRVGPVTATRPGSLGVPPSATVTPNAGARQLRRAMIVSRTVPNVPIVLSSPTPNKLNRRQASKSATTTTTSSAAPTRSPPPRSTSSSSTPVRIAAATSPSPSSSSSGGQLSSLNSTSSSSPELVVKILAAAQGALALLAMGAVIALPAPLERVGTDALPAFTSLNNVSAGPPDARGSGAAFQPGLGDAADATMYSSSPMDSKIRMGASPRMVNPHMHMDSVESFSNQPVYGEPPPPQPEYYSQQPEPAYYPIDSDQGYYADPDNFPPQPSYADTLPMTTARSPAPQFYDNPAYTSPPPPAPRAYAAPPMASALRPSHESRGTFASNRLYQDGGYGALSTPSVGTGSAGVPSVGGPGDYASDTLRSGFSLRNVGAVPGMQERGGVGRVPPPGSRGGGVERTRVEPKRAMARTMYLSDDDE